MLDRWQFLHLCLYDGRQLAAIWVETDRFVVDIAGPYNFTIWADSWTPSFLFEIQRIPKLLDNLSEDEGLRRH